MKRRQQLIELERDAATDVLTEVGNCRSLNVALAQEVAQASSRAGGLCVVSIDLDGLKTVDDQYGHARGDALLRSFSAALLSEMPQDAELYRLGGDEFVALCPVAGSPVAETHGVLEQPCSQPGLEWLDRAVAASAGMARFPEDASTGPELLHLSDERLYAEKKQRGSGRV